MDRLGRVAGTALFLCAFTSACAGTAELPSPRSIIVYSGERVQADPQRMAEVEDWLMPQLERIDLDPEFLIRLEEFDQPTYPWANLELEGDTASLGLLPSAPDAETPYLIYGFLRLMDQWDTLATVLPEAQGTSGYDTERAIVHRVAEVWLLGRSVFDTQPYGPLDELVYAQDYGFLDEFIFATQGERFADEAEAYYSASPGREAEFRDWFRRTFEADGPRFMLEAEDEEESNGDGGDQAGIQRERVGHADAFAPPPPSVAREAQHPGA